MTDLEKAARMALEAGFVGMDGDHGALRRFAALVAAAEREKVAVWMIQRGYATGHGDTTEDMLKELDWQVAEREREACAKVCENEWSNAAERMYGQECAETIRARSNK